MEKRINVSVFCMLVCTVQMSCGQGRTVQELVSRIEAIERKVTNQEQVENMLLHELKEAKQMIQKQEDLIHAFKNGNFQTKLETSSQDQRISSLENKMAILLAEINMVENEVIQLLKTPEKPDHTRRRRVVGQPVAFQAVAKQDQKHIGVHQPILFETVLTNIGTAFHVNHGTFTAPVHGIYLFSVSAPSAGEPAHPVIATELVKEGTVLAKTYSKSDTGYVDQGSVTVVTELQSGNKVWVRLNHPADTSMNSGFSSFTGVLLYEFEA